MLLHSLQIGIPKTIRSEGSSNWWDKEWTTGFYKDVISTPVWVGYQGLKGDGQSDRRVHGGVDKAICVYPSEHYPFWGKQLGLISFNPGAFGENFTTKGFIEEKICIGDTFSLGKTILQVSQPRQPCWKLSRRWKIKDLSKQVEETGKTGFYLRVLTHGFVQSQQAFELIERPYPNWTLARCNTIMHHQKDDLDSAASLGQCTALSGSWKDTLLTRSLESAETDSKRHRH